MEINFSKHISIIFKGDYSTNIIDNDIDNNQLQLACMQRNNYNGCVFQFRYVVKLIILLFLKKSITKYYN